jgi:uncharacterized protein YhfF
MNGLPPGPASPSTAALEDLLARAGLADDAAARASVQVRWIGLDAPTTRSIFELIRKGDKTGTFTLPWIVERTGLAPPAVGQRMVLIDHDGTPVLLLRTTEVREVVFGRVTAADIAIDGSPVRDPAIWKPLHTDYWNALLQPFGLAVSDDMPFWAERFTLLFDAEAGGA